jgi:hypothetical protein
MAYQVEKMSAADIDWIYAVAEQAGWDWYLLPKVYGEKDMLGSAMTVDRSAGSFMLSLPRRRDDRADHYLFHCAEGSLHLWYEAYCEFSVDGCTAGLEGKLEQARDCVERAFKAGGIYLTGVLEPKSAFEVPAVTFVPAGGGA